MDADAVEIRVLGCLIEKQRTTPDAYPLSLNSLRLACNQATNRDPVVAYEEREIKAALDRMANRGWTRFASGASSRALKYRHLLDEAIQLSGPELSLLGVLMLRGAQTVGELKQRSERLHKFDSIAEVAQALDGLAQRELVERLERRPGQKEERWRQLLGADSSEEEALQPAAQEPQPRGDDQVAAIEQRLERLERAFDDLLGRLDKVPDRE
jgi:uncharacterized protein YceH (UPF0502 family)